VGTPSWVNLVNGSPVEPDFGSTYGSGSPIAIDQNTGIVYFWNGTSPQAVNFGFAGARTVESFGAKGDGVTNDGAAFVDAIAWSFANGVNLTSNGYYRAGPPIFCMGKKYFLGTTNLSIYHCFPLIGSPSLAKSDIVSATWLQWSDLTTGITVERYNTSAGGTGGDGFTMANMRLSGGYTATEGEYNGIHVRARMVGNNINIDGFSGDGIMSDADDGGSSGIAGNSNGTRLVGCTVSGCRDGLRKTGQNSNAWVVVDLETAACRRWGRNETSFLGSTYIGGQISDCGLITGVPPSVVSDGASRWAVGYGQESVASVNPPVGTSNNIIGGVVVWYYLGAGGTNLPLNIPLYTNGMTLRAGGAALYLNANSQNRVYGCYTEGGQGPIQGNSPSVIDGGQQGAGVSIAASNPIIYLRGNLGSFVTENILSTLSLNNSGSNHNFGPSGSAAAAADYSGLWNTTNNQITNDFYTWTSGVQTRQFRLNVHKTAGVIYDALLVHNFEINSALIWTSDSTGIALQSGKVYKVNGLQVVTARKTGWSTDTGTALRSSLATYVAGATLTFSSTYIQSEQTASATRIAAIEAALQNISQTIKALKDDLHSTAGHGLIGP
jgi:hypothetical protein